MVALDQRGYGQSDCPEDIDAYDITHLVGDVVGLMKALDSGLSAVLVGGTGVRLSPTAPH